MNSKILSLKEEELCKILLKKEQKTITEDSTIIIDSHIKLALNVLEDVTITIIHQSECFARVELLIERNKRVKLREIITHNNAKYKRKAHQDPYSTLLVSQIISGGEYIKTDSYLKEKSTYNLTSAYYGNQLDLIIVNSSTHLERESNSNLIINGAAKESKIYNDGIVSIRDAADDCSGHQHIKNIVLDSKTTITSEPILEISNHNVSCSHGASTSKLDPEILLYSNSRGIDSQKATQLALEGFFHKALELTSMQEEDMENIISKVFS